MTRKDFFAVGWPALLQTDVQHFAAKALRVSMKKVVFELDWQILPGSFCRVGLFPKGMGWETGSRLEAQGLVRQSVHSAMRFRHEIELTELFGEGWERLRVRS